MTNRRLIHRNGRLSWEIYPNDASPIAGPTIAEVDPEAASKICAAFNSLDEAEGRDFWITLPETEPKKGREHQEGSHEFADVRMHSVGQIALPRGRKQIHTREVLIEGGGRKGCAKCGSEEVATKCRGCGWEEPGVLP